MFVLSPIVLLSLIVAMQCHELFTDTIPKDYYLRKDLTDCSERFHKPKIYQYQCIIFGGEQTNVTDFPHMAVLGWPVLDPESETEKILWQCGGSLITERFVLTAAHCASDANNIPPRLVRFGDVDLASSAGDENAQQFEIRQIIRHPKHLYSKKYFDLALVELNGVASFTTTVIPACLWPKQALPAEILQTAGFGAIIFGGEPVPNLLKTNLHTMVSSKCMKFYEHTRGLPDGIASDQLCGYELNTDTCQGDSGGPLQVPLGSFRRTQPFVVAVTSFGRACGTGSSGVYQRVAPYIPWIESVVNETMDPVHCSEKYASFRQPSTLAPECTVREAYSNRVRLLWPAEAKGPQIPCGGTFVDYNTVVTSARCAQDLDDVQPNAIELLESEDKPRAQIVEIQVHPEFDKASLRNDLALLRLDKYLQPDDSVAPSCIPVAEPSEICSERHTHDPVQCWDKFAKRTKMNLLNSICTAEDVDLATVQLVWAKEDEKPPCKGMFIKSNTVITSIRCMNNHSNDLPVEIELAGLKKGTRMKIANIILHPGFKDNTRLGYDTAILLLEKDMIDSNDHVPRCIKKIGNKAINVTHIFSYGLQSDGPPLGSLNLRSTRMCNESMVNSFTDLLGNSLVNDSRYTCWDTEQRVVPGAVSLEPGAGLLDETHRFIRGVAAFNNSFGTVDPVISTNLSAYIDWITRFVLYRPPKQEIVYPIGEDEFELGSMCMLKNGTQGNCLPDYACRKEITMHKNIQDITVCGFEGSISYVCCPPEHQAFPLLPELEVHVPDPFPPLPYENGKK